MRIQRLARHLFAVASVVFMYGLNAHAASAQSSVPPPPVAQSVDSNGVDLMSGSFTYPAPTISTAGISEGAINYNRIYVDNWTGVLNSSSDANGSYLTVSMGSSSEKFKSLGSGNYTPVQGGANALNCSTGPCIYTLKDGTQVYFDTSSSMKQTSGVKADSGLMTMINKPDGEQIMIYYKAYTFTVPAGGSPPTYTEHVLRSVSSSKGWMIKYESSADSYDAFINKIYIINTTVDYCDPYADSCTSANASSWPTLTINNGIYKDYGGTTLLTINPASFTNNLTGTITTPTGVTKTITLNSNLQVTKVQVGSTYWTYGYTTSGNVQTTTVTDMNGGSRVMTTDISKSQVLSDRDELGRKTQYTYDSNGRIYQIIQPDATWSGTTPTGGYTQYAYDGRGNVTTVSVYPKGGGTPITTTASYPASCANIKTCNQPDYVIDSTGVRTDYTYDSNHGGVLTETKPAVNSVQAQMRYSYSTVTPQYYQDTSGVRKPALNPVYVLTGTSSCMTANLNACVNGTDERKTSTSYNTTNVLPYSTTVSLGDNSKAQTTTLTYDNNGNVIYSVAPGKSDGTYSFYDNQNRLVGTISLDPDAGGSRPRMVKRITYDGDGHVTKTELGTTTGTTSNDLTNNTSVVAMDTTDYSTTTGLPLVSRHYDSGTVTALTQTNYDSLYRVNCVAQRLNSSNYGTITSTDACTLGAAGPDGNDRITKYNYDATGAVTSTVDAYGTAAARTTIGKQYDATSGLLASETDGDGNITAYTYDNFDRMVKTCYPTASNGTVTNTGDCEQKSYSGSLVNQVTLRDNQTINFYYDALARVSSKTGAVTESFSYNNFSQVTSHTNNGHTSNYSYNALGWLSQESNDSIGGSVIGYGYDGIGRLQYRYWPDGHYVYYGYDVGDEVTAVGVDSTTSFEVTYDYDNLGRRWHLYRSNGQTTTYAFDTSSRLSTLTQPSNTYGFTYTQANQIKTRTQSNTAFRYTPPADKSITYGINGLNQISNVNGTNFSYDTRGNTTGDGGATYAYNANNLLTTVTQGAVRTDLTYDAENRLYSLSKPGAGAYRFVYDGGNIIAEYDISATTLLRRYVYGPGTDEPLIWYEGSGFADKRWLFADNEGSITQAGGTVNKYDEYGLPISGNAGRFQYTGQAYLPEVGLYYYKARMYNPVVGRFMQTDPIGYGDGMNWYAYVHDDPVNLIDPTGLDCTPGMNNQGEVVVCGKKKKNNGDWVSDAVDFLKWGAKRLNLFGKKKKSAPPSQVKRVAHDCPTDGYQVFSANRGFTGFAGIFGVSANGQVQIAVPNRFFRTLNWRGVQVGGALNGTVLGGVGAYFAKGPGGGYSNSPIPLTSGVSVSKTDVVLQAGAADEAGIEASISLGDVSHLGDIDDLMKNGWSGFGGSGGGVSPREGGGMFVAAGLHKSINYNTKPIGCTP